MGCFIVVLLPKNINFFMPNTILLYDIGLALYNLRNLSGLDPQ